MISVKCQSQVQFPLHINSNKVINDVKQTNSMDCSIYLRSKIRSYYLNKDFTYTHTYFETYFTQVSYWKKIFVSLKIYTFQIILWKKPKCFTYLIKQKRIQNALLLVPKKANFDLKIALMQETKQKRYIHNFFHNVPQAMISIRL